MPSNCITVTFCLPTPELQQTEGVAAACPGLHGCFVPSKPSHHGANRAAFCFLRHAATFQKAFQHGLCFLRNELMWSLEASDTAYLGTHGGKNPRRSEGCKNPVKPLERGVRFLQEWLDEISLGEMKGRRGFFLLPLEAFFSLTQKWHETPTSKGLSTGWGVGRGVTMDLPLLWSWLHLCRKGRPGSGEKTVGSSPHLQSTL